MLSAKDFPVAGTKVFLLILNGSLCMSFLIPMMGFFVVTGLGKPAWMIGIYTGLLMPLTLISNRFSGEWLDRRAPVRTVLLIAISAFLGFCFLMSLAPSFALLIFAGVPLMALANIGQTAAFTFGRLTAEQEGYDAGKANSWYRMAVSFAWMIGPSLSFSIIAIDGFWLAFSAAFGLGACWLLLCLASVPAGFRAPQRGKNTEAPDGVNWLLYLAALCCLMFVITNSLFMPVLALYLVEERGLPAYLPGLSLSIKCFVEVFAIFGSAWIATRIGVRPVLSAAAVLGSAAMIAFANADSIGLVLAISALEGLYYGLFAGVAITYVQSFAPDRPGRATALYMNCLFLGGLIGSVSMGFIASASDYRTVVLTAAVASGTGFILLVLSGFAMKQPVKKIA